MEKFKDLFSTQSKDYSKFRPTYPQTLFDYLSSIAPAHDLAWDAGTGNGQAAAVIAETFQKVIATDPSEKQLSQATQKENIVYQTGDETNPSLKKDSVDLVTVAQAFHWFNHERFFEEAQRVLKPKGIVAVWTYHLAWVDPDVDKIILYLYRDILNNYWEKERVHVENGYSQIRFPFKKLNPPPFKMEAQWTLEHLLGYLNTWSPVQTYIKKNGNNPVDIVKKDLTKTWGSAPERLVKWPLTVIASHK